MGGAYSGMERLEMRVKYLLETLREETAREK
jgi:hypothetical protein